MQLELYYTCYVLAIIIIYSPKAVAIVKIRCIITKATIPYIDSGFSIYHIGIGAQKHTITIIDIN